MIDSGIWVFVISAKSVSAKTGAFPVMKMSLTEKSFVTIVVRRITMVDKHLSQTINVILMTNGIITHLYSFLDGESNDYEAEVLFASMAKDLGFTPKEILYGTEDGILANDTYQLLIMYSRTSVVDPTDNNSYPGCTVCGASSDEGCECPRHQYN